ncbi:MAG: ribosomal protein L7/L12, partial [Myxococcales bacterium]
LDDIIRSIEALSPDEMEDFLRRLQQRTGLALPTAQETTMETLPTATMGVMIEYEEGWDVHLLDHGPSKIMVIKVMRDLKGLGLKETLDLVESAPVLIFESIERGRAEDARERLIKAGAKVELR